MDFFLVLNDGETYSALEGCKIIAFEHNPMPSDEPIVSDDDLDYAIKHGHPDIVTVTVFQRGIEVIKLLDEQGVEAAARALASEFGCEVAFGSKPDLADDPYSSPSYWNGVATPALTAYFAALDREAMVERVAQVLADTRYGQTPPDNADRLKARAVLAALGFPTPDTEEQG